MDKVMVVTTATGLQHYFRTDEDHWAALTHGADVCDGRVNGWELNQQLMFNLLTGSHVGGFSETDPCDRPNYYVSFQGA